MARSLSRWQAVLLALVVMTGLVLAGVGLFAAGSRQWFQDAFHLRAGFTDIGGVVVGTRVRVQGMDAGEVTAIELPGAPGEQVLLHLTVAGKYRKLIGGDARVQIASESLLLGKIVVILPGSSRAPVEDGALLAAQPTTDLTASLAQATTKLQSVIEQADETIRDFRQGKGAVAKAVTDLSETTVKVNKFVTDADSLVSDVKQGQGTLGKLVKDDKLYTELTTTIARLKGALDELSNGEGTLGKLAKNNDLYLEALKSVQEMRSVATSVKQNSDAIKAMPIVRSYVVDVTRELVRPASSRQRMWIEDVKLFRPGEAILSDSGRQVLDAAATWLNGRKDPGSEVLVAAFAPPTLNGDVAKTLTDKQSEVVVEYLRSTHKVHRLGFWYWSNRTVRGIGCGNQPTPVVEKEKLPPGRVEIIIFVPQG